jgi:hypothetical protein
MGERDFIALIDGVHQLLKAPIVLVWDRLNTHVSDAFRFPNVIVWFGVGGHELRLAAGGMGVVRPFVSLVEVAGAVGARSAGGPGEEGPGRGSAVAG